MKNLFGIAFSRADHANNDDDSNKKISVQLPSHVRSGCCSVYTIKPAYSSGPIPCLWCWPKVSRGLAAAFSISLIAIFIYHFISFIRTFSLHRWLSSLVVLVTASHSALIRMSAYWSKILSVLENHLLANQKKTFSSNCTTTQYIVDCVRCPVRCRFSILSTFTLCHSLDSTHSSESIFEFRFY